MDERDPVDLGVEHRDGSSTGESGHTISDHLGDEQTPATDESTVTSNRVDAPSESTACDPDPHPIGRTESRTSDHRYEIEPGCPSLENVVFVLLGVIVTSFVIARGVGLL